MSATRKPRLHDWVEVSSVAELEWCWRCGTLRSEHNGLPVFLPIGRNPRPVDYAKGDKALDAVVGVDVECSPHPSVARCAYCPRPLDRRFDHCCASCLEKHDCPECHPIPRGKTWPGAH